MFLRAGDTISGQEGKATANIDGNVHDMFFIKSLEATFEKLKTEVALDYLQLLELYIQCNMHKSSECRFLFS